MDDTLDAWDNLVIKVLERAARDATAGDLLAILFLYSDDPAAEWFCESIGMNLESLRTRLLNIWAKLT